MRVTVREGILVRSPDAETVIGRSVSGQITSREVIAVPCLYFTTTRARVTCRCVVHVCPGELSNGACPIAQDYLSYGDSV